MSGLLASVEAGGELVAEALTTSREPRALVAGAAGSGKASALRHAYGRLQAADHPSFLLEADDSELAPVALLSGLRASLEEQGHELPATVDADRDPWEEQIEGMGGVLADAGDSGAVLLLSGVDRLQKLGRRGGAPGRHAREFLELVDDHASRLGIDSSILQHESTPEIDLARADLSDWLVDSDAWGSLASAAERVAERGDEWWDLPALSLRFVVGLEHLGALKAAPPITPFLAGREFADALAADGDARTVWAAWQLVAGLRGPLSDVALTRLLQLLPGEPESAPLLTHCVLFNHEGWQIHPATRLVARRPGVVAKDRVLPRELVARAGRTMVGFFQSQLDSVGADRVARTAAEAALLDACAMAEDVGLTGGLVGETPDPYDHIGQRATHSSRSRPAFARANAVDARDALALRGLANAEDVDGIDPDSAEGLFREALGAEPQDASTIVRLVGVLLAAGRPEAAEDAFADGASALEDVFEQSDVATDLCVPTAKAAIIAGNLPLAMRALSAAVAASDTDIVRDLQRLVKGFIESLEYGEYVTSYRLGTEWWTAPQTLSDYDADGRERSRWLAARVDSVVDGEVTLLYADVLTGSAGNGTRPPRSEMRMALKQLEELSQDILPDPLVGTILEVGIYGRGAGNESTHIRVVESVAPTIPTQGLPVDRYVRR